LLLDNPKYDAIYGCTISVDGKAVGYTTSGGFGYRLNKSVALGYVEAQYASPGTTLSIGILGDTASAQVVAEPAYDPKNELLRA